MLSKFFTTEIHAWSSSFPPVRLGLFSTLGSEIWTDSIQSRKRVYIILRERQSSAVQLSLFSFIQFMQSVQCSSWNSEAVFPSRAIQSEVGEASLNQWAWRGVLSPNS